VHVENGAADPVAESIWIDGLVADNGLPSVQVAGADLTLRNVADRLAGYAALPSVRGVRDILNWHPDPVHSHRDRDGIMTEPRWRAGFDLLGELGLSFDLQVFPHQLRQAARLAADHGDTAIVVDHAGMPIERDADALAEWARGLRAVAAEPNTMVKISALGTNDHSWRIDSIRRIVLDTIDAFGPSRTMFASNFPVDGLYSTYATLFSAFLSLTADLPEPDREELFAGSARRFYRMSPAVPDGGDRADPPRG
jgi:predicted TIM-barrel fold metal-dependent hydrolase